MPDVGQIGRFLGATDAELGLFPEVIWHIYARGDNYQRVGEIEDWTTLELVLRFNEVGTWVLETSSDSPAATWLTKQSGIIVTLERNNIEHVVFSGPVAGEIAYTDKTFRTAGVSDDVMLRDAITRATPSATLASSFTNEYDVYTGVASTVMRRLVDVNIGPSAPVYWRKTQLILASDPLLGSTITSRTNLDPILTYLRILASTPIATGLGFRVLQSETQVDKVEFSIYAPQDKSDTCKFSVDLNTIQDFEDVYQAPKANYVYVLGGDGFGLNRTIVEGSDSAAIAECGRIIPVVIDKRGVTDLSELEQALAEALATAVALRRSSIVPFDIPNMQFGREYNIGDLVSVTTPFGTQLELVTEAHLNISKDKGTVITPVVGRGDGTFEDQIANYIDSIQGRVENLERNWNVPDNSLIPAMFHDTIRDLVGDLKLTARASAQTGWLICDGSAISRSTYSALFAAIGTTYGVGNNTTTFNIPDFRERMPIGAGGVYTLGELGGADTLSADFGSHSHNHSHGGGTLFFAHVHDSQSHTHPGSHSHGIASHYHVYTHNHSVSHTHDHGGITSGPSSASGRQDGSNNVASEFHWHDIASSSMSVTSGNSPTNTNEGRKFVDATELTSTEADSNVFAASYTGSRGDPENTGWTGGTEQDTTAASITLDAASIKNKFQCVNFMIYTSVT